MTGGHYTAGYRDCHHHSAVTGAAICGAHHTGCHITECSGPCTGPADECHAAVLLQAYDGALVRFKGAAAATNFSVALYQQQLAEHHQMKLVSWAGAVTQHTVNNNMLHRAVCRTTATLATTAA